MAVLVLCTEAFHDCIQASRAHRERRKQKRQHNFLGDCAGGVCMGVANGPHQGGNASYPVAWNGTLGTRVEAYMTVPALPTSIDDSITYYIWTDVFFGDEGRGIMNQLVPQLILGDALDGSSGPPNYEPKWGFHDSWAFASHYYFELQTNKDQGDDESHAAYGEFFPAHQGEVIRTTFELSSEGQPSSSSPKWTLTMEIVGDDSRVSVLVVNEPYMGMDASNTKSWLEGNYTNMCINSCWELYGAVDAAHLPSSGATYMVNIEQPVEVVHFPFSEAWVRDEGDGYCPRVAIHEEHNELKQSVWMEIRVDEEEAIMTQDLLLSKV